MDWVWVVGGLLILMLVIVAGAIIYEKRKARQRQEDMQAAAEEMGLEFIPKGDDAFSERVSRFKLFNKGHDRKILNIVLGETEHFELTIFDYHYTTGGGEHQQRHRRAVALMESPELKVPAFTMRPEGMFDKLGAVLGLQDIDFKSHPVFSTKYLLKGDDEQQIRDFFDDSILSLMEKKQKLCVEAVPGKMIVYYANRPPRADQLKSLFAEALEIYSVFDERAKSMPKQTQDASNANYRSSS